MAAPPFSARLGERTFEVGARETLLEAAERGGVPFPSSCRVGGCATCRCRLVEGRVRELTETAYLLTAEELERGTILACQSVPLGDVNLALDRPPRAAHSAADAPEAPARAAGAPAGPPQYLKFSGFHAVGLVAAASLLAGGAFLTASGLWSKALLEIVNYMEHYGMVRVPAWDQDHASAEERLLAAEANRRSGIPALVRAAGR